MWTRREALKLGAASLNLIGLDGIFGAQAQAQDLQTTIAIDVFDADVGFPKSPAGGGATMGMGYDTAVGGVTGTQAFKPSAAYLPVNGLAGANAYWRSKLEFIETKEFFERTFSASASVSAEYGLFSAQASGSLDNKFISTQRRQL